MCAQSHVHPRGCIGMPADLLIINVSSGFQLGTKVNMFVPCMPMACGVLSSVPCTCTCYMC